MAVSEPTLETTIRAGRDSVYQLIAELELWPAVFPHIRSAQVVRRVGSRRIVTVTASWRGVPIGWRAVQTLEPEHGRVTFRHIAPVSRGTTATWTVRSIGDGRVSLSVEQHVALASWIPGRKLLARLLAECVGPEMGRMMLERAREVAEGGSLAGRE